MIDSKENMTCLEDNFVQETLCPIDTGVRAFEYLDRSNLWMPTSRTIRRSRISLAWGETTRDSRTGISLNITGAFTHFVLDAARVAL